MLFIYQKRAIKQLTSQTMTLHSRQNRPSLMSTRANDMLEILRKSIELGQYALLFQPAFRKKLLQSLPSIELAITVAGVTCQILATYCNYRVPPSMKLFTAFSTLALSGLGIAAGLMMTNWPLLGFSLMFINAILGLAQDLRGYINNRRLYQRHFKEGRDHCSPLNISEKKRLIELSCNQHTQINQLAHKMSLLFKGAATNPNAPLPEAIKPLLERMLVTHEAMESIQFSKEVYSARKHKLNQEALFRSSSLFIGAVNFSILLASVVLTGATAVGLTVFIAIHLALDVLEFSKNIYWFHYRETQAKHYEKETKSLVKRYLNHALQINNQSASPRNSWHMANQTSLPATHERETAKQLVGSSSGFFSKKKDRLPDKAMHVNPALPPGPTQCSL